MAAKGDLVAVQKEVSIGGSTHTRTYWMKAEDAAKAKAEGATVTGEKKKFSSLTPAEKKTYWKQAAAKAVATKKAPAPKPAEVKPPEPPKPSEKPTAPSSADAASAHAKSEKAIQKHGENFNMEKFKAGLTEGEKAAIDPAVVSKQQDAAKAAKATAAAAQNKWKTAAQKAAATKAKKKAALTAAGAKPAASNPPPPGAVGSPEAKLAADAIAKFGKSFDADKFVKGLPPGTDKVAAKAIAEHLQKMAPKTVKASVKATSSLPQNVATLAEAQAAEVALANGVAKQKGFASAMQSLGAESASADKMKQAIDSWSGSANSDNALKIRGAAIKVLADGDPAKEKAMLDVALSTGYQGKPLPDAQRKALESGFNDPKMSETIEASAKVAQSMYDDEYITVYRGVTGELANKTRDAVNKGGTTDVDFDVHSLSCWSESQSVAAGFAGTTGVVVAMKIHRSSIAASHRVPGTNISSKPSGDGNHHEGSFANEKEVFVASTGKVTVSLIHDKKTKKKYK